MTVERLRRRFTVADYHKMIDVGILHEDDRVELLNGEINQMSPLDPKHVAQVNRLNDLFSELLGRKVIISVQNPVALDDLSEPEPDLALLRRRSDYYASGHPSAADVLLLIEVANTSAQYDRTEKLPRYAAAGMHELWIINLKRQTVEQYTQPDGDEYLNRRIIKRGTISATHPELELTLTIDTIFGSI
jgi:Uma2 family endonuclease